MVTTSNQMMICVLPVSTVHLEQSTNKSFPVQQAHSMQELKKYMNQSVQPALWAITVNSKDRHHLPRQFWRGTTAEVKQDIRLLTNTCAQPQLTAMKDQQMQTLAQMVSGLPLLVPAL